jgi:hypothetical protein
MTTITRSPAQLVALAIGCMLLAAAIVPGNW